jgi:hypothetical protein
MKRVITLIVISLYWVTSFSQLNLNYAPLPVTGTFSNSDIHFISDISYDSLEISNQTLDLFLPDTLANHSLVIYVHGGGFTHGNKNAAYATQVGINTIEYFLNQGVAFASIGYRFLPNDGTDDLEGVIKPMSDVKRALQFVRYFSEELHIEPGKVVMFGSSAGGGTILWLHTHDNMGDINNINPILRENTRPCAAYISNTQASNDLYRWETDVYDNYDGLGNVFNLDSILNYYSFSSYSNLYGGVDSTYEILYNQTLIDYRADVDMLGYLSSDDGPLYIVSSSPAIIPAEDVLHHPLHSVTINEFALNANLSEVYAEVPSYGINTTAGLTPQAFLINNLNDCYFSLVTPEIDQAIELSYTVYPNPVFNGILKIDDVINDIDITVRLLDLNGQIMDSKFNGNELWIGSIQTGIYFLKISSANRSLTKKIIVK